jgi:hypothetical protein
MSEPADRPAGSAGGAAASLSVTFCPGAARRTAARSHARRTARRPLSTRVPPAAPPAAAGWLSTSKPATKSGVQKERAPRRRSVVLKAGAGEVAIGRIIVARGNASNSACFGTAPVSVGPPAVPICRPGGRQSTFDSSRRTKLARVLCASLPAAGTASKCRPGREVHVTARRRRPPGVEQPRFHQHFTVDDLDLRTLPPPICPRR